MLKLSFLDWIAVFLYFVFIIGIGFYLRKFSMGKEDFFLAGRRNSALVSGIAFLSANLGALEILGWTGASVKYGILTAHFYWIGAIPAMIFLGIFMMPFYYHGKIYSVPGYLKYRFDERTKLLNAFSFALMTLLMSGVNIYLMALIFHLIFGWNWHISIWFSGLTVGLYVALGGLMSAIFTEVVQFFLIWFGLFLVPLLGFIEFGGKVFEVAPEMLSLWKSTVNPQDNPMGVNFLGIILGLGWVLSFGYWTTDFLVVQRAFASKDLNSARLAPIIASFFKILMPAIVTFGGFVSLLLISQGEIRLIRDENGNEITDSALPLMMARYFPSGLMGFGVVALLAGFMAGQAGNVTAFNTVFSVDIYQHFRKNAGEKELVFVGRVMSIVGMILSILAAYLAMQFPTIMDYIQAIFSWVNAPLFATILLGMFWKRTTPSGAFWGLILGMLSSFLMFVGVRFKFIPPEILTFYQNPSDMALNLWRAWWAWLVTFLSTIIISLFTKPKPYEEIKGLVKGTEIIKEEKKNIKLYQNPVFWAVISLSILIILNVIFF